MLHNLPDNTAIRMDEVTYDTLKASVQNLKSMFNGWLILARGLSFIENSRKSSFQSEEAFLCYQKCIKCLWSAFLRVFSHPIRQVTSNAENEWACHIIKTMTDSSTSIFSSLKIAFLNSSSSTSSSRWYYSYYHLLLISQSIQEQSSTSLWSVSRHFYWVKSSRDPFYWLYSNLSSYF